MEYYINHSVTMVTYFVVTVTTATSYLYSSSYWHLETLKYHMKIGAIFSKL